MGRNKELDWTSVHPNLLAIERVRTARQEAQTRDKYVSVVQLARHGGLKNRYEDTMWVQIPSLTAGLESK